MFIKCIFMQMRSSPERIEFIYEKIWNLIFRYQFATVRVVRLGVAWKVSLYLSLTERYFRPIQVRFCMYRYQDTVLVLFDRFLKKYTKS